MSLTPGATLQNRKYVIQSVLHQSDFGVTYQAQHAYLERPVALQTLNPDLRERKDFAELRQQFLSKVPALTQQLQGHILDCFEEDQLPFVVLEFTPGQVPPQLSDWFPIPPTVNSSAPDSSSEPSAKQSGASDTPADAAMNLSSSASKSSTAVAETQPPPEPPLAVSAAAIASASIAPAPKPVAADTVASSSASATSVTSATSATQPTLPVIPATLSSQASAAMPVAQPSRAKAWMPIALVSMCMLGGLVGAGLGLSLRLTPAQSQAENRPSVPHRLLFNREQNFPAEANWPISETPLFTSDPTPVEEPVYRVSPPIEDYSQPTFQPVPDQIQQPVLPLPSSQPTVKATSPSPLEVPVDAVEPSPIAPPSRTTTVAPDLLNPANPAPVVPVEPAPSPIAAPELPAPAATELLPEAAPPPMPDLPAQKPAVIKQ